MTTGNLIMDDKNPTGIKEHDTSCVIEQSESTTNKEKNVKKSADKQNNNNNKKKIFILGDSMVKNVNVCGQFQKTWRKNKMFMYNLSLAYKLDAWRIMSNSAYI